MVPVVDSPLVVVDVVLGVLGVAVLVGLGAVPPLQHRSIAAHVSPTATRVVSWNDCVPSLQGQLPPPSGDAQPVDRPRSL